jgi:hypothetical protein
LSDGTPIYDRLGQWFTLVCSRVVPSGTLVAAAKKFGMPLHILLAEPEHEALYGCGLLLVRPDQHIAWRGRACDDAELAEAIVARCLGGLNRAH